MEKLKPVLEHKFWILLAAVLLLAPVAWWMGTSPLSAEITLRTGALDNTFKTVDGLATQKDVPNEGWTKSLADLNKERTAQINTEIDRLWKAQSKLLVFPERFREKLPDKFQGKLKQFGRSFYREHYESERQRVRKIVEPLVASGEGKVYFPDAVMIRAPGSPWEGDISPTDEQVWDAQEDLWLTESLLNSVKRVNQSGKSIVDAPIREIRRIRLRGGSRPDLERRRQAKSSAATTSPTSAPSPNRQKSKNRDKNEEDNLLMKMMQEEKPAGGQRSSSVNMPSATNIDLNECFGAVSETAPPDFSDSNGAAAAAAQGGGSFIRRDETGSPAASADAAKAKESRYIDEVSDTQKFATRGFYLHVIMDHRELPLFLEQLANSPFPVEVQRVHISKAGSITQQPRFDEVVAAPGSPAAAAPASRPFTGAGQAARIVADPGADAYRRAMNDPVLLADVAIVGMMTLYRPPTEAAAAIYATSPAGTPAAAPSASAAGANGAQVAAPNGKGNSANGKADGEAKPSAAASGAKPAATEAKPAGNGAPPKNPAEKQGSAAVPQPGNGAKSGAAGNTDPAAKAGAGPSNANTKSP